MCRIHFVRLFAKEIPPDPPVCFMVYHLFTCWNDNENSGIPVYPFSATPTRKKTIFEGLLRPQLWWFELLWIPGWTHKIPAWWVLYADKIVFQSYMVINGDHDLNLLSGLCFNGWYVSGIGIVSSKPWFFPAKLGGKSSPLQFVGSADPVPRHCDDGGDAARGNVLIVSGQAEKRRVLSEEKWPKTTGIETNMERCFMVFPMLLKHLENIILNMLNYSTLTPQLCALSWAFLG